MPAAKRHTPAPTPPALRIRSLETAAEYADVSEKTVRRWVNAGTITGYRIGPRMLRVDLNEIDAMLRVIPTAK